jgi:hypothetical protein
VVIWPASWAGELPVGTKPELVLGLVTTTTTAAIAATTTTTAAMIMRLRLFPLFPLFPRLACPRPRGGGAP